MAWVPRVWVCGVGVGSVRGRWRTARGAGGTCTGAMAGRARKGRYGTGKGTYGSRNRGTVLRSTGGVAAAAIVAGRGASRTGNKDAGRKRAEAAAKEYEGDV